MATVIFDFDSTLITCESFEEIVKEKKIGFSQLEEIEKITWQAMSGKLSFFEALQKKLQIVAPNKQEVESFGKRAINFLTPGMEELIKKLHKNEVDVWILSGASQEVLSFVGNFLNISKKKVRGIIFKWSLSGAFEAIDAHLPINQSKAQGAKELLKEWSSPKIMVGDGMTDYDLYEKGCVDAFIAFTKNVKRPAVLEKKGVFKADSMQVLALQLSLLLNISDGLESV